MIVFYSSLAVLTSIAPIESFFLQYFYKLNVLFYMLE